MQLGKVRSYSMYREITYCSIAASVLQTSLEFDRFIMIIILISHTY